MFRTRVPLNSPGLSCTGQDTPPQTTEGGAALWVLLLWRLVNWTKLKHYYYYCISVGLSVHELESSLQASWLAVALAVDLHSSCRTGVWSLVLPRVPDSSAEMCFHSNAQRLGCRELLTQLFLGILSLPFVVEISPAAS